MVSVDVKDEMDIPDSPYGLCGREATLNKTKWTLL